MTLYPFFEVEYTSLLVYFIFFGFGEGSHVMRRFLKSR
jgi:hypothetical protein